MDSIPALPVGDSDVEHLIAWLGTILAVLLLLGHLLDLALPSLRRAALRTETKADDDAVDWLSRVVAFVMLFGALFPRLRLGRTDEEPTRRPPRRRTQDGSGGAALALLAAALVTGSLYCTGCSPSALALQADGIAVAGRVLAQADVVVVHARARDLDRLVEAARVECGASGCAEPRATELVTAYDARVSTWAPVRECAAPVRQGLSAWLDAVELASLAANQDLSWQHATAEAARVVLLYDGFRLCVGSVATALGETLDIPALPAFVLSLAESAAP